MSGLIQELKRRNVFKVGAAYAVIAWLVAQGVDVFLENFGAPAWVIKTVLLLLVAGFPLALVFAWAYELTPEGLKKEKDVDRSQSITHETGRKLDFFIIGVLLVALGYFAYDKFSHPRDAAPPVADTAEAGGEVTASTWKGPSIAVLPFVNMSEDASNEFFSDGISEEILNALASVKELKVAGRTSSFAFKGQNQDLRQVGEALGVKHILEGSVRKSGNKVRITAQLIQVDDGFHLWSETYDRELNDVFAIQDEISQAILGQLKAQLVGETADVTVAARTNPEAYELYLLAKQRLYERTGPNIQSAAELLDKAISIDPNYAPAYAQRGIATLLLSAGSGSYGEIPQQQALSQAKLYIDKALEMDEGLAEGWAGLGLYYLNLPTGGTEKAIETLQKALAVNPGLIDASNWLHNVLMQAGDPKEAQRVMLELVERDPLYRPGIRNVVNGFLAFGEPEKALAHLERIQPLIPNDAVIQSSKAAVRISQGQTAEGMKLIDSAVELQPTNSVARLTRSFAWMNLQDYARVAAQGEEFTPIIALTHLGRVEEASQLAFKRADEQADVGTLFGFLNMVGRSGEVVSYIEERWTDLSALRKEFPPYGALGDFLMLDVALAYSRAGNTQRFDEAMGFVRKSHEVLIEQGVNNNVFLMTHAAYLALAGDREDSLEYLDRAVNAGAVSSARIVKEWPAMESLEGDPRFTAIQTRMMEMVNAERKKLGMEPV